MNTFLLASALRALFNTLDPSSPAQALAFYQLYPECSEGKEALERAACLLAGAPNAPIGPLAPWINRTVTTPISEPHLCLIEKTAAHFPNRRLKGYHAVSESEVLALPSEDIDLGKALLLSQLAGDPEAVEKARLYSAQLDLMALQIEARLPKNASCEEKIRETNRFIFEEMRFRFPPQSIYAQDIDLYTFLPSVMDNHLGVCLGVTALYLAISQRLDLPLEIVTPPGHIYVRYRKGDEEVITIETTARGIDVPTERYLGVGTRKLETRTIKEVVGMTHFNQASVYLHQEKYDRALVCYEKARTYMADDPLAKELLGYSCLFVGRKEEGRRYLSDIADHLPDHAVAKRTWAADYLSGEADEEALKAVFMSVDETRTSILKKQQRLKEALARCPRFRAGLEQLAVSYVQLGKAKEGIDCLLRYHEIDPQDPTVEYYLAVLHGERSDFRASWRFLKNAEQLTYARSFSPKALKELRKELTILCPEGPIYPLASGD